MYLYLSEDLVPLRAGGCWDVRFVPTRRQMANLCVEVNRGSDGFLCKTNTGN